MNNIVIIVRGGIIQEVYSKEDISAKLIDLDNYPNITDQEITKKIDGLRNNPIL